MTSNVQCVRLAAGRRTQAGEATDQWKDQSKCPYLLPCPRYSCILVENRYPLVFGAAVGMKPSDLRSGGSIGGGRSPPPHPLPDAVHRLLDGVHLPYTRLHKRQNMHQI